LGPELTVTIEFLGPVIRPEGTQDNRISVAIPEPPTVRALLLSMGYQASHVRAMGVFREGSRLPVLAELIADERLVIAIPFGGG
jgi:hypothetical protein